ncbi:glycosyltransferase [Candidatus Peregrinibacteria bacterium]|nr:glycosyltransferase [Candidatus Peregrinibacteria bacterium]
MKLSVIIPTHNRADTLKVCLEKVIAQQGVDFEVIVVDDGSTDNTELVVEMTKSQFPKTNLSYIKQKASHQGTARNRGVEKAEGEIIVFIGDDIFIEPGFLMKHHDIHAEYPDENMAVLGFTTWDPNIEINAYMRFLESSGWQFGYKFLHPKFIGQVEPYKFFYTSNISLKKSLFDKEKFNEDFVFYGWEDIEIGYRLWKNHGMKIYYEPSAIAYHHHHIPESGLTKKMRNVGKSAVHFQRIQPNINVIPMGLKALILRLASNKWSLPLFRILGKNTYYKLKSWNEFMNGVKEAD